MFELNKYLSFLLLIATLATISFAQSVQVGCINAGIGAEVKEEVGFFYLSTGISGNGAAISLNQGAGLNIEYKLFPNFFLFGEGGMIGSLLFANQVDANAILLSGAVRVGFSAYNFKVFGGLFKELLAFNTSHEIIWPSQMTPEVGIGYQW